MSSNYSRSLLVLSVIIAIVLVGAFRIGAQTPAVYFDYPIPVESYDPYSFGRPLGASGNHSGEDIQLSPGTIIVNVADGVLIRYKTDAAWVNRTPGVSCGYGKLYATIQYTLNRQLKIPIGIGTFTENSQFTMEYGHINDRMYPSDPDNLSTGIPINDDLRSDPIAKGVIIGYVGTHASPDCGTNDLNGDGAEHLHHGSQPGYVPLIGGYSGPTGKSPTHLVIAASRVGVFRNIDGTKEWKTDGTSQAFFDKWWEHIELANYHNKLGRPRNNHPDAPILGTDFVHWWSGPGAGQPQPGVWIQDFNQPFPSKSRFGSGYTALILNTADGQVRLVREGFRDFYLTHDGYRTLGAPTSEEYPYQNGSRQDFQNGYLVWDTQTVQMHQYTVQGQLIATHEVTFTSSPAGAQIWSDFLRVGNNQVTPFSIQLEEGTYRYTAKLLGSQDVTQEFTVTGDMTVNFQLQGTGLQNPYGLHLVDRTTTDMTLAWNYNGSLWNTRFKVYKDGVFLQNSSTGQLSAIIYGLTENTQYQFFVTALDNTTGFESGPSNTITETTLPEPSEFPIRLMARSSTDFPVRYDAGDFHPDGGVSFYNTYGYIRSRLITYSQTGQYQMKVVAKRAYSGTPANIAIDVSTYNSHVSIYEQLPATTDWQYYYQTVNVNGAYSEEVTAYGRGSGIAPSNPVLLDSIIISYVGPFPPVLSVDSTALHFGSEDTLRTFNISNAGGPGLNWACTSSDTCVIPLPTQGAGNYTVQALLNRNGRAPGSYVDTLTVTSNAGSRTLLVYSDVPEPPITNLLPNGGFESGFNPWIFQNWPNRGTATVTGNGGEFVEGSQGLRVDITDPGVYWEVHVRQDLSFSPQEYTISFWAKAAAQRTVILNAHEEGTWINLNLWQEPIIGTSWTFYSYTFTPGISTSNGQLVFNVGASGTTVWLDDVQLTTGEPPASPILALSTTAINLDSTLSVGSFIVSNSGGGTLNWNTSESSTALTLSSTSGTAPTSDTVSVNLNRSQATVGTHADTVLVTSDGGNGSVIVHYVILPPSEDLLTNGGFETGSFSPWEFQEYPGDQATETVTSSSGEYTEGSYGLRVVIHESGDFWTVQVRQQFAPTPQEHILIFWVKSDSIRTIVVDAYDRNTETNLGLWQSVNLTTSWQQLTYAFTPPAGYSTGWIHFYLGEHDPTVWIDGVSLTTGSGGGSPANLLANGDFESADPLDQGDDGRWGAEPLSGSDYVEYSTADPIAGTRSLHLVKTSQSSMSVRQYVDVTAGQQYIFSATLRNSSNISGQPYIDNYQVGGCWCNQGLWWNETLTPGIQTVQASFTPTVSGPVNFQFQWTNAVGETWIDDVSIAAVLAKQSAQGYETAPLIPERFALYQNYPNPFNPTTTFRFDLPEVSEVKLVIYNVLGQQVAVVTDKIWEAGAHSLAWNASSFSSGMYFYSLRAGDKFHEVKKLLLMK